MMSRSRVDYFKGGNRTDIQAQTHTLDIEDLLCRKV